MKKASSTLPGCRKLPPTMALLRALVQMKQAGEFEQILARYR
jgi:hypothetical protein